MTELQALNALYSIAWYYIEVMKRYDPKEGAKLMAKLEEMIDAKTD